jgi:methionyl-tRNA synthetase
LLEFYDKHPSFIQPESRRNEVVTLVQTELRDVNITRTGEPWGIRVPFDPDFTIYVWFDALLNYVTAIGYGSDEARFKEWWPADVHFIGKDITRFHCALWPAMLWAAGVEPPHAVFGHGFVNIKNEETGEVEKISKSIGNVVEPMDLITNLTVTEFRSDVFRYYFMRECPFPSDGEFSWQRFRDLYNSDFANNLGNLYSRVTTLVSKNYDGVLPGTAGVRPATVQPELESVVKQIQAEVEASRYNVALEKIWRQINDPANQYAERTEPWKLVKSDKDAARPVLHALAEQLRIASILLKPFLPRSAEAIYRSFNFVRPWAEVRYEDTWQPPAQTEDLRLLAALEGGKPKPLFPRIA